MSGLAYVHPAAECDAFFAWHSCGAMGVDWSYPLVFLESNHVLLQGGFDIRPIALWDAGSNIPNLAQLQPAKGDMYRVAVAGSTSLGGIASWVVNDMAIYDGTAWRKITPTPVDLTGATAVAKVRRASVQGELLLTLTESSGIAITNATAGVFTLTLSGAQLSEIGAGIIVVDVIFTLPEGTLKAFPAVIVIDVKRLASS